MGIRAAAEPALAWLLRLVLLVALVPFGSTGAIALPVATLGVSLWCVGAFALLPRPPGAGLAAVLVAFGFLALALFQIWPGMPASLADPAWGEASALLAEPLSATVSVSPSRSLAAIPVLVAPFLLFAAVTALCRRDRSGLALLRFQALAGTSVAGLALVQYVLFPQNLLLEDKRAYLDSFTAVFANRNSAAAFLGLTALVLMGLAAHELKGRSAGRMVSILAMEPGRARREARFVVYVFALFLVTVALFLTKSRAGIASGLLSAWFLSVLLSLGSASAKGRSEVARHLRNALLAALGLGVALWLLGGQTLRRATQRGFDDDRFCVLPGMWRAAVDHWPLGSGAATFDLVFPAYRDPACGIYWTWDRAHNVFLEGLVTMGAPFALLSIAALVGLVVVLARGWRQRRRMRFVPATGLACLLLLVLHDLLDFPIQIPGIAFWSAALLGSCAAVSLHRPGGRPSLKQS